MAEKILKLIQEIDINYCDDIKKNVRETAFYKKFEEEFPLLKQYLAVENITDEFEFRRTLYHTFRVLVLYSNLRQNEPIPLKLSEESISEIRRQISMIDEWNSDVLPLLLLYHDIGRVRDRRNHAREGAFQLKKLDFLGFHSINDDIKHFITQVTKYHLLMGTIYTGERSHHALWSLFLDDQFLQLLKNGHGEKFFQVLTTFTMIDVMGYSYSRIYDHYITYYLKLQGEFLQALKLYPNMNKIKDYLKKMSGEWLEWRLASALRIFQQINTSPKFTKQHYREILMKSYGTFLKENVDERKWTQFLGSLTEIYRAQLPYGLPNLMILANNRFIRSFDEHVEILPRYFSFWINLNESLKVIAEKNDWPCRVVFQGIPHWSKFSRKTFKMFSKDHLQKAFEMARHEIDEENLENLLFLRFQ
ncbi:MAG: hypothetical protein ACTSRW_03495 [Candidatus Helarchaeota archaeon]